LLFFSRISRSLLLYENWPEPQKYSIIGLTYLKYKIKYNRSCGWICDLYSWRSNPIDFLVQPRNTYIISEALAWK